MKYDQANDNYSITLTDTNNTLADINFSASGITCLLYTSDAADE